MDWTLSDDGLTYTFQIHPDAKFIDGQPVTATDVQWSYDRVCNEEAPWPNQKNMCPFYKGSTVLNPKTVQVITNFQAAPFFSYLASPYAQILPKHHFDGMSISDRKLLKNVNGSGPFTVKEHIKDTSVEYTKNPNYFKDPYPYFDGMKYFVIIEPGAIIASFKAGKILYHSHANSNLTSIQSEKLGEDMVGKARVTFEGPVFVLWTSINDTKPPFDDVRVRRALQLATDREAFIKTFSNGNDLLAGAFPPGFWFGTSEDELRQVPGWRVNPDGSKSSDDIAEAQKLLADAGYPNGEGFPNINYVSFQLGEFPDMSVLQKQQWKQWLNIDSTIDVVSLANYVDVLTGLKYDMLQSGYSHTIMEPDDIIAGTYAKGGRANPSDWSNPRIEELYLAQQKELDIVKRKALIDEIGQILQEVDSPHIFYWWAMRGKFVDNRIHNWKPGATDAQHPKNEHMWCDPDCS